MRPEVTARLKQLETTLTTIEKVMDPEALAARIRELEAQAGDPSLWDDPAHAQQVTSELSAAQAKVRKLESLRGRLEDMPVMYELAEEEGDTSLADDELDSLESAIESLEVTTMLSGEYDPREAVINIRSGAGGVDAADWAEMLMRMYTRWAEKHGHKVDVYDISYAEEAGIKSATFVVHGEYMYGQLSVEQGAHRLVRISPFDNQGRRQTSFAEVEVLPVVEQTDHIDIPDNDVRVDVYRSSGPGGQSVNTTDSAVRLTHIPTGIVVTCQNEKSQIQNKASAMRVLQAKLLERKRQEEQAELDALGAGGNASWGNQMRSYVLHPYQMVKDLRTNFEVGDPSKVLDGDIDGFLESGIRWRMQQQEDKAQVHTDRAELNAKRPN
ncbi:peptide chain release factor 2 [Corynebacterium marquesiae]|uniref:Peptide chain release factor 2 n=4 Tax=Bacillati TaxID=1783272 RepID=A0ABU8P8L5_9CORY